MNRHEDLVILISQWITIIDCVACSNFHMTIHQSKKKINREKRNKDSI